MEKRELYFLMKGVSAIFGMFHELFAWLSKIEKDWWLGGLIRYTENNIFHINTTEQK